MPEPNEDQDPISTEVTEYTSAAYTPSEESMIFSNQQTLSNMPEPDEEPDPISEEVVEPVPTSAQYALSEEAQDT
ncbi:unnamed protein product [Rotaria socialis]|uniref:Uncharacterized protein n=2 Tax=Rotaria socialis TaxID=392032 RepID=A0A818V151_9BILA|nr:unnamed protein product [Rotaria socialis]